jgi:hypothetical protein
MLYFAMLHKEEKWMKLKSCNPKGTHSLGIFTDNIKNLHEIPAVNGHRLENTEYKVHVLNCTHTLE